MKFVLDHDVPDELSYLLRELGHEVLLLRQVLPTEASDEKVLNFARDNGCAASSALAALTASSRVVPPSCGLYVGN